MVLVIDNESHEAAGKTPTFTAGRTDLVAMARGAGIAHGWTVRTLDEFGTALAEAFAQADGTSFLDLKVEMVDRKSPLQAGRLHREQVQVHPPHRAHRGHPDHQAAWRVAHGRATSSPSRLTELQAGPGPPPGSVISTASDAEAPRATASSATSGGTARPLSSRACPQLCQAQRTSSPRCCPASRSSPKREDRPDLAPTLSRGEHGRGSHVLGQRLQGRPNEQLLGWELSPNHPCSWEWRIIVSRADRSTTCVPRAWTSRWTVIVHISATKWHRHGQPSHRSDQA